MDDANTHPFRLNQTGKKYKTLAGAMSGERIYAFRKGGRFIKATYAWRGEPRYPYALTTHYRSIDGDFNTTIQRIDGRKIAG
jgi:hypothetical protein